MIANGVVILLEGGHSIETCCNWDEVKMALNEDINDGEFVIQQADGKWASIIKNKIVGYKNL
jgi:hypothetical protein